MPRRMTGRWSRAGLMPTTRIGTRTFLINISQTTSRTSQSHAAVMTWSSQFPFVLSANLVANYPFDDTSNPQDKGGHYVPSPDDKTFIILSKVYSLNHPSMKAGKDGCGTDFKDRTVAAGCWSLHSHWVLMPCSSLWR